MPEFAFHSLSELVVGWRRCGHQAAFSEIKVVSVTRIEGTPIRVAKDARVIPPVVARELADFWLMHVRVLDPDVPLEFVSSSRSFDRTDTERMSSWIVKEVACPGCVVPYIGAGHRGAQLRLVAARRAMRVICVTLIKGVIAAARAGPVVRAG